MYQAPTQAQKITVPKPLSTSAAGATKPQTPSTPTSNKWVRIVMGLPFFLVTLNIFLNQLGMNTTAGFLYDSIQGACVLGLSHIPYSEMICEERNLSSLKNLVTRATDIPRAIPEMQVEEKRPRRRPNHYDGGYGYNYYGPFVPIPPYVPPPPYYPFTHNVVIVPNPGFPGFIVPGAPFSPTLVVRANDQIVVTNQDSKAHRIGLATSARSFVEPHIVKPGETTTITIPEAEEKSQFIFSQDDPKRVLLQLEVGQ